MKACEGARTRRSETCPVLPKKGKGSGHGARDGGHYHSPGGVGDGGGRGATAIGAPQNAQGELQAKPSKEPLEQ